MGPYRREWDRHHDSSWSREEYHVHILSCAIQVVDTVFLDLTFLEERKNILGLKKARVFLLAVCTCLICVTSISGAIF